MTKYPLFPRYLRCLPEQLHHLSITWVQSKLDVQDAAHLASMITTHLQALHLKCLSSYTGKYNFLAELGAFEDFRAAHVFWTIIPEMTTLEDLHAPYFSGSGDESSTVWKALVTKIPSLRFVRGRYFSEVSPFELLEIYPSLCHIDVSLEFMNTEDFNEKQYSTVESLKVVVSPHHGITHALFNTCSCVKHLEVTSHFGPDKYLGSTRNLFDDMLRSSVTGESIESLTFRNVHVNGSVSGFVPNFVNLSQVNFRCTYQHTNLYGTSNAWLSVDPYMLALSLNKCKNLSMVKFRFCGSVSRRPQIRWYFNELTAHIRTDLLSIGTINLPSTRKPWPQKCPQVQRLVVHEALGLYINGIKQAHDL